MSQGQVYQGTPIITKISEVCNKCEKLSEFLDRTKKQGIRQ